VGAKLQNGRDFDWGFDPTADQGDTWPHVIGAVHHAGGGHADASPWTGSVGPRWTDYITNRYI